MTAEPGPRELVLRLLTQVSARTGVPAEHVDVACAASQELLDQLSPWIGKEGARVLLERALAITRRRRAALAGISVREGNPGCFAGVGESVDTHGREEVFDGLLEVLVTFIELLGRFLGEPLTLAVVESGASARGNGSAPARHADEEGEGAEDDG